MNYENATMARLREGKTAFGTFQCIGSAIVSEIIANRGFDWVLVDMEHGSMGIETAADMLAAIDRRGPTPFIRVPDNDRATIKRALDAGAMGVMVPMVNSPEEAAAAVDSCKYSPGGSRGLGAGRASLFGVRLGEYAGVADSRIMVMLQAEHGDAVKRIDGILAVPGIDVIFVGPYDLACSMGYRDQPGHPAVEAAIAAVLAAAGRAGVVPGIFCMEPETAKRRAAQGFRLIGVGIDSLLLDGALRRALSIATGGGAAETTKS